MFDDILFILDLFPDVTYSYNAYLRLYDSFYYTHLHFLYIHRHWYGFLSLRLCIDTSKSHILVNKLIIYSLIISHKWLNVFTPHQLWHLHLLIAMFSFKYLGWFLDEFGINCSFDHELSLLQKWFHEEDEPRREYSNIILKKEKEEQKWDIANSFIFCENYLLKSNPIFLNKAINVVLWLLAIDLPQ